MNLGSQHFNGAFSALIVVTLLFLSSCATQKPIVVSFPVPQDSDASQGAKPAPQVQMPGSTMPAATSRPPQAAAPIPVPITDYNAPDNTPSQPEPTTDKDIEDLVTSNNIQFEIKPQTEDYHGGAVVYNYIPQHVYRVFVAPLQLTTVTLEPGESLVSAPAAGDTSNFMVATTLASQDGKPTEQVFIKAVYAGKSTTLAVDTNRRSYFLHLYSYDKLFMPLISFNYPLDLATSIKQQSAQSENNILLWGRVTDLDFAFQIIPHSVHKPAWSPDRVFTDGKKTYISFPSAARASYAPVLFEVNEKNERTLVPYRVIGSMYVADEVIRHAELVLDINEGNIITIIHKQE